jgi:hypothetical protein
MVVLLESPHLSLFPTPEPKKKQQGLVDTNPGGLNGHMRKHYTLYN